eukprot:629180-Alexandrium_andersonii.AAC.1
MEPRRCAVNPTTSQARRCRRLSWAHRWNAAERGRRSSGRCAARSGPGAHGRSAARSGSRS